MPLNRGTLKKQLKEMFSSLFPKVFEHALLETFTQDSEQGKKMAEQFGKTIDEMLSEPMADELSSIIDTYIKNADVYGTVLTFGSASSQTATINSPSPISNGKTPNSFGIK